MACFEESRALHRAVSGLSGVGKSASNHLNPPAMCAAEECVFRALAVSMPSVRGQASLEAKICTPLSICVMMCALELIVVPGTWSVYPAAP